MPLIHLFRTQLHPLAEFLGLPRVIVEKAADPDIMPGVDDNEGLLGSFDRTDRVLIGLELGVSRGDLIEVLGEAIVDRSSSWQWFSAPIRESPYALRGSCFCKLAPGSVRA